MGSVKKTKMQEEQEMIRLREELKNMQQMFQQLTEEGQNEIYDVRRSYMLKSQIVQLERQCMLLSGALSSRASIMNETENQIINLTEKFQELLAQDVPGPNVTISRKQLISHIQAMQKLKGSLQKQSVLCSAENLRIPQISGVRFCKTDVTCMDVCTGKIDHINLQHVARLEGKLTKLFKQLTSLQTLLRASIPLQSHREDTQGKLSHMPEQYLYSSSFKKIQRDTDLSIKQLEDCCQDLLSLSLLHPSAPWSVVQKPSKFGLLDPGIVMSNLSTGIRQKNEVKSVIGALCKAHSYLMHMNNLQLQAYKEEIYFCNKANITQAQYMNDLLQGIMLAYKECENGLGSAIHKPVDEILSAWLKMKESQSDNTLREFLTAFKENETALEALTVKTECQSRSSTEHTGLQLLEEHGQQLDGKIKLIQQKCAEERSKLEIKMIEYAQKHEIGIADAMKKLIISSQNTPSEN